MKGQFRNAVLLALSIGISAPAATVWAEAFLKIEGVEGEATSMQLSRFPGGSFSPMQLRNLQGHGIETAGDLISADPALVGRILGISPRQARMTQRHLSETMRTPR